MIVAAVGFDTASRVTATDTIEVVIKVSFHGAPKKMKLGPGIRGRLRKHKFVSNEVFVNSVNTFE